MKAQSIKKHLTDYSIYVKRWTTINHAFASALSVPDKYDINKVSEAIKVLGQDPDKDLLCVYCKNPAQTWDHIKSLVSKSQYSGNGHQIGNLVPCCTPCNSEKISTDWKEFIDKKENDSSIKAETIERIEKYIHDYTTTFSFNIDNEYKIELQNLQLIKEQIFELMKKADIQATAIRNLIRNKQLQQTP